MKCVRMPVAIDLDGVLFQHNYQEFCVFLNRRGYSVCHENFRQAGCWNTSTGLDSTVLSELFAQFLIEASCHYQAVPGAFSALSRLRESITATIVTARRQDTEDITRQRLNTLFPGIKFQGYAFGFPGRKDEAMRCHGLHLIIEDSPVEAELILKGLPEAYVVAMPNPYLVRGWQTHHPHVIIPDAARGDHRDFDSNSMRAIYLAAWVEICEIIEEKCHIYHQQTLAASA
jgi:hypothetical protein